MRALASDQARSDEEQVNSTLYQTLGWTGMPRLMRRTRVRHGDVSRLGIASRAFISQDCNAAVNPGNFAVPPFHGHSAEAIAAKRKRQSCGLRVVTYKF